VANNKSAKKRIQIAERNRLINKSYKSTVRTLTKKTLDNCEKYKKEPNEDNKNLVIASLNRAFSLIDKAVKKNVLHKNNGANKKSKINKSVKKILQSNFESAIESNKPVGPDPTILKLNLFFIRLILSINYLLNKYNKFPQMLVLINRGTHPPIS